MSNSNNNKIQVYLKIIDYKRSIGITQWTIFSIFFLISGAIFFVGLEPKMGIYGTFIRVFAAFIYWIGYLLYNRYRSINKSVSKYLIELEKDIEFKFENYLNEQKRKRFLSTNQILIFLGILYIASAIIIGFLN